MVPSLPRVRRHSLPHLLVVTHLAQSRQHLAAERNRVAALRVLIGMGADPNACGSNGTPPLTVAAHSDAAVAVEVLLEAGADRDAEDMNGGTALHAAAIGGSREAVRRLLQVLRQCTFRQTEHVSSDGMR